MPKVGVNDRLFLLVDSEKTPQHVACLGTLHVPDGAGPDFVAELAERLRAERTFAPPFNYRLRSPALRTIAPSWQVLADDEIDLDQHFTYHRLPDGAGERELGELISALHEQRLDWRKPLWEYHLVDGLDGGRFALYFKVHHALMDGVGGVLRFTKTVSADPADTTVRPLWTIGPSPRVAGERPPKPKLGETVRGLLAARKHLKRSAKSPSEPAATGPYAAPKTVANGRLTTSRRMATCPLPLARVKGVAKAAGGTVNDVFVTIVAGGLRRYLAEIGDLPGESLTAGTPVNVRAAGDETAGNAFSLVVMKMFTDIADPAERLKAVARSAALAKEDVQSRAPAVAANYGALILGGFALSQLTGLAGRGRPPVNLTVSCVPGPAAEFYVAGARIEALYPIGVLYHGTGLFIASFTFSGTFGVGVLACPDELPHVQHLALYIGDALTELEQALGVS